MPLHGDRRHLESRVTRRWPSGLWRHGDFLRLWSGQTASMLGDHVTSLALPTIAILQLHASAWDLGVLTSLAALPYPILALPAGVLIDRVPKRPVMIGADAVRLLVLATVPAAFVRHSLSLLQLDLVALAAGSASTFFLAAYRAYLPRLVTEDALMDGNAKLEASHAAAHVAGPGLGGLLIQAVGGPQALVADLLSFVASIAGLVTIRRREVVPAPDAAAGDFLREARDGLRVLVSHPVLARLAAAELFNNLGLSVGQAVFLLFAYRVLAQRPGQVGLILGIGGVAGLAGALAAARLGRRVGVGPAMALATALGALGWAVPPLALLLPAAPVLVAAVCLQSFFEPVWSVNSVSVRQQIAPAGLQGRVHASMAALTYGAVPVGAFIGGTLGTFFGQMLGTGPGLALTLLAASVVGLEAPLWIAGRPMPLRP